jgi:ABC-type phosphate/phosphonate transport system substrate-binding protein
VDKELTDSIRNAFLTMNSDTQGKEILSRLLIDRFVEAEDSWYDSIRNAVTDKRKN